MRLHLVLLVVLLISAFVQCQVLVPGLRTRQVPVLENGQIRPVPYLEMASTVTPESLRNQFSMRFMTLAKPLVAGTPPQATLPGLN
ncbi:hypothetical protein KR054_003968 [Drosophila jambulina]|nr:hypothetical protein KR054_003968 [Drosophila jambulina]